MGGCGKKPDTHSHIHEGTDQPHHSCCMRHNVHNLPCGLTTCIAHARLQILLHAPEPSFYSGDLVSPWVLSHWDTIKKGTVAALVSYPLVLILALMQVRTAKYSTNSNRSGSQLASALPVSFATI